MPQRRCNRRPGVRRSVGRARPGLAATLAVAALLALTLPGGVARGQGGRVCLDDPAGDVRSDGPVAADQTRGVDLLQVCGLYQVDGTLTLDYTVVDAAPDPSWSADAPPRVSSLLDSPEFVFVQGIVGGRSDVYAIDPELGLEPYCADPSRPDGSATLQLVGNTYRLQTAPGCIDVDVVSTRGFGANRFEEATGRVADDSVGGMQLPRSTAQPPPLGGSPPPEEPAAPEDPADVVRLAGPSRVETAVAISQDLWPDVLAEGAVIATAGNFADAQTGTPLAVDRGPLLLSGIDSLHPASAVELQRAVRPGSVVYLVGGTAALSDQVAADVAALGFGVARLAGSGRAETSVAIAEAVTSSPNRIFFVDGGTFPPGILAGAATGRGQGAVVVSGEAGADYIARHPDAEAIQIGDTAWQPDVDRTISGSDPTELSLQVATQLDFAQSGTAGLASAEDFPDGLAGSVHAATNGFPIYLTPAAAMPDVLAGHLVDSEISPIHVYGGTGAISTTVTHQAVGEPPSDEPPPSVPADGAWIGDGSQLAGVAFGTSQADTIAAFAAWLGQPFISHQPNDPACDGRFAHATWEEYQFSLAFLDDGLVFWGLTNASLDLDLRTSSGVRLHMTQDEVRALHPDVVFEDNPRADNAWIATLGPDLEARGHYDSGRVSALSGGRFPCAG